MQCVTHPTRSGLNTCCKCGSWLCEDCTVEVGGRMFCRRCLHEALGTAPAREPVREECCRPASRKVSWGLLFMFTVILPGLNYMYEGLLKRGLFALCSFFALAYLTSALNAPIFGMMIVILWITCAFDGFQIRRRINAGEYVEDGVDDITGFLKRNKSVIITFACVLVAIALLSSVGGFISNTASYYVRGVPFHSGMGSFSRAFSSLLPWLAIGLGIGFIAKVMKKDCRKHHHHHGHMEDHGKDDIN